MTKRPLSNGALDAEALSAAESKTALEFIEAHLFEPMSVKTIAASCGVSPFRFSREFTRRQGESVMAYVRGRRLESTMRRLLVDPDVSLVDLAFDSGFDSQEAFTRAFARAFGQTPGRFRRTGTEPLIRRRRPTMETPTIHQSVEVLQEFRLAGLPAHFTPSTFVAMGELWQRFASHMGFEGQLGGNETYGVWSKRYPLDGSFDFFAAVRIDAGCTPPEPLETVQMPPRTYLVFKQMLRAGELHPQMLAATEEIWSQRLPRSGRTLLDAPDFQIYPTDFKVEDGGYVAHYLPIAP